MAGLPPMRRHIGEMTNRELRAGDLPAALAGADAFIGVSTGNILTPAIVRQMAADPIIFALANPIPEGDPDALRDVGAYRRNRALRLPNQINNVLSFPGIFRGALNARARAITPGITADRRRRAGRCILPGAEREIYYSECV
ncbi:MAG: hypothetical protein U0074_01000 [Kouleothrix sp.]